MLDQATEASSIPVKTQLEIALENTHSTKSFQELHSIFITDMNSIKNIVADTAAKMIEKQMRDKEMKRMKDDVDAGFKQ
tara:strand:- start:3261 stop:3497 length:237 start_codon:yes stop_codon:yes gene_type:complete